MHTWEPKGSQLQDLLCLLVLSLPPLSLSTLSNQPLHSLFRWPVTCVLTPSPSATGMTVSTDQLPALDGDFRCRLLTIPKKRQKCRRGVEPEAWFVGMSDLGVLAYATGVCEGVVYV